MFRAGHRSHSTLLFLSDISKASFTKLQYSPNGSFVFRIRPEFRNMEFLYGCPCALGTLSLCYISNLSHSTTSLRPPYQTELYIYIHIPGAGGRQTRPFYSTKSMWHPQGISTLSMPCAVWAWPHRLGGPQGLQTWCVDTCLPSVDFVNYDRIIFIPLLLL